MIITGFVLMVIGWLVYSKLLWLIGAVVLLCGVIVALLRALDRRSVTGRRRRYF
jgi:hypothetical protein